MHESIINAIQEIENPIISVFGGDPLLTTRALINNLSKNPPKEEENNEVWKFIDRISRNVDKDTLIKNLREVISETVQVAKQTESSNDKVLTTPAEPLKYYPVGPEDEKKSEIEVNIKEKLGDISFKILSKLVVLEEKPKLSFSLLKKLHNALIWHASNDPNKKRA